MIMTKKTIKRLEAHLRRTLANQGYILQASRTTTAMNINDWGGYRIIDTNNCIVAGEHFNLSLDDVVRFAYE